MKILITGGGGQVAHDLKKILQNSQVDYLMRTRQELDITNESVVSSVVDHYHPDVIINLAAYTQVDRAESEMAEAMAVNFSGVKNLVSACKAFSCHLVQVSTDYVFDGETNIPYLETDSVNPVNLYGQSKLQAEQWIVAQLNHYLILRVSAVFGVHGTNFVKTILRLAKEKTELNVINDQFTCPTPAVQIAETLFHLAKNKQQGVFHYCGDQTTSWCEFAKKIIEIGARFETFSLKNINSVSTDEYKTAAKRPRYSVLNCEKIKNIGIPQPNWEEELQHVIQQLSNA